MRIVQVAAGLDEPGAGPSYSVTRLAAGLRDRGFDVGLHSVEGWRAEQRLGGDAQHVRHRQDFAGKPVLGAFCFSRGLRGAVTAEARAGALIHSHGLWLAPNIAVADAARRTGARLVTSPRGMLGDAALAFSSRKKALVWRLAQRRALERADCLHATGHSEYDEIRRAGLTNPVAIIPNGIDAPQLQPRQAGVQRTLLTLGRVHPKKGLPDLVDAWAGLEARFPDWNLRIVGPDELGHAEVLRRRANELGLSRISIEPAAFGQDKVAAYQAADLFVLPSLNENFAITVAEALAAGVPVVATKGAPWPDLQTRGCGWWVDIGAASLERALSEAMSESRDELRRRGEAGRRWMMDAFSWASVAERMARVYRWLNGEGDAPPEVLLT